VTDTQSLSTIDVNVMEARIYGFHGIMFDIKDLNLL
jgi:hypothetical protein